MTVMDFRNAGMFLNASLNAFGPPMAFVAPNGTGKTTYLKSLTSMYPKSALFSTAVDYGGFKQYEQMLLQKKIKTLVVSDMQSIVNKPTSSKLNIIRLLTTIISEGTQFEMTYSKDRPMEDFTKRKKNYTLNLIIGCTENHIRDMIREGYDDLLVRMVFIRADRKEPIDPNKPFKMPLVPKIRFDKKTYEKNLNELVTTQRTVPRETMLLHQLESMLKTLDFAPQGEATFYRPMETRNPKDKTINLETRMFSTPVLSAMQPTDVEQLQQFLGSTNASPSTKQDASI